MQRSAVVLAAVNNDVIDNINDVVPSHRRRRSIEGIVCIEQWAFDTKNIEVSRYFDILNIEPALLPV